MIQLIGWVAAAVALLTSLAMLQDASMSAGDNRWHSRIRHALRLIVLVGIAAASAVLCILPEARQASIYEVFLRCCLAGFMAMQSPCPWWAYVFKGKGAPMLERRRNHDTA